MRTLKSFPGGFESDVLRMETSILRTLEIRPGPEVVRHLLRRSRQPCVAYTCSVAPRTGVERPRRACPRRARRNCVLLPPHTLRETSKPVATTCNIQVQQTHPTLWTNSHTTAGNNAVFLRERCLSLCLIRTARTHVVVAICFMYRYMSLELLLYLSTAIITYPRESASSPER